MSFYGKTTPPQRITAWSISRYGDYNKCPAFAKYKHVLRMREPDNPAAARGTAVHKKAEDYLLGKLRKLPAELAKLQSFYVGLRKRKPAVELELAFDSNWRRVDWFAAKAWVRIKIDAIVPPVVDDDQPTVDIYDHKTGGVDREGKLKEVDYTDQLEVYGLAGLLTYPVAKQAQSTLLMVDAGKHIPGDVFPRAAEAKLRKKWEKKVVKMLNDTKFTPTPGPACRYCHFRQSNGGPCVYG